MNTKLIAIFSLTTLLGSVLAHAQDFDGTLISAMMEEEAAGFTPQIRQMNQMVATMALAQATTPFESVSDEWAALGKDSTEADVIAAFGQPSIKHESFEDKSQIFDYHYAGHIACQVLLLEDGTVADKQILKPDEEVAD